MIRSEELVSTYVRLPFETAEEREGNVNHLVDRNPAELWIDRDHDLRCDTRAHRRCAE